METRQPGVEGSVLNLCDMEPDEIRPQRLVTIEMADRGGEALDVVVKTPLFEEGGCGHRPG